jgi:site-specific DNA-methyltransferase (adenine-specific)
LTCAIEDAGFEIRDCLSWLYGSGFPKSLDVSKAIDKAAGAERPVTGVAKGAGSSNTAALGVFAPEYAATDAATDAAKQWEGWGTALKPAWEPIIMARKPIQGTVAENVQRYGTGAINVDGCRIATDEDTARVRALVKDTAAPFGKGYAMGGNGSELGRWPANVALDEEAARLLDQQSGVIAGGDGRDWSAGPVHGTGAGATFLQQKPTGQHYSDTGGASRFFYTAKASRSERGEGNTHPTVKPLSLMRWLVTMVTPPDGCVLDPFMGSGTTLLAAKGLGFRAIGIEMDESYCAIAANRLGREMVGQSELL